MDENSGYCYGTSIQFEDPCTSCLSKSLANFLILKGVNIDERSQPFSDWWQRRYRCGVAPYARIMASKANSSVNVIIPYEVNGSVGYAPQQQINFASQDYLGLAQSERIESVAVHAIKTHGVHSAGSPAFIGRTLPVADLELKISDLLQKECAIIFPTGWAAGYGVIAGLVRSTDHLILDSYAHSCLQEGASRATSNIYKMQHNNLLDLERILRNIRSKDQVSGVFIVLESLYSMDSDSPDILGAVKLAKEYSAITILDVAHDFGSMGTNGLGALEDLEAAVYPDVILGSFSKTFATNGGFAACSKKVKNYLYTYSSSHLFSNAISPMQASVALECMKIAFDEAEGRVLRNQLMDKAKLLRKEMMAIGCEVGGKESPIVPVYVGEERYARLAARYIFERGVLANLVEFPAVPRGKARFRFQLMATHSDDLLTHAAELFKVARNQVDRKLQEKIPVYIG
jgi:7-keto-8-aminopelargonate synthetase-like enzyme